MKLYNLDRGSISLVIASLSTISNAEQTRWFAPGYADWVVLAIGDDSLN